MSEEHFSPAPVGEHWGRGPACCIASKHSDSNTCATGPRLRVQVRVSGPGRKAGPARQSFCREKQRVGDQEQRNWVRRRIPRPADMQRRRPGRAPDSERFGEGGRQCLKAGPVIRNRASQLRACRRLRRITGNKVETVVRKVGLGPRLRSPPSNLVRSMGPRRAG